ncbi:ABC transporter substrate-binding protein [Brevibacillus daliensis]|uniref:ABC transporter substrate-binding protein n=1 Tax=Brevibacillus daliensis TaxID=2892995 RepID=UPI001E3C13D6|nr:ABC transporter substrate-binding protein [Brevibacillus daliensis]
MKSKGFIFMLLIAIVLLVTACGTDTTTTTTTTEKKIVQIGITQIVEHPALDAEREGFIQAFIDAGYMKDQDIVFDVQSAQGDMNNNKLIAQKFAQDNKDLIFAIATPTAQAIANETTTIPILFGAVTDPVGAGLVKDLNKPEKNVTGSSDSYPEAIEKTMTTIKEFFPQAKSVGIIFNTGEQNSIVQVEQAKKVLETLGLTTIEATATNSSEVKQAAESLVGRVDVFYVPLDNTAASALDSIIKVANNSRIPVIGADTDYAKKGVFAAYGVDYHALGYQTGTLALDIIKNGKKPGEIAIHFPKDGSLVINESAAAAQGVDIQSLPKEIVDKAQIIK